ncbi:Crp/Fnr family transcriptional regulator [Paraburkholderia sediminicola]|uniref:Crp/Fnr family transcriptional regulator n=1 Tax=Paraburkholderia TaxID=1822464 RepID=UPI0038B954BD
MTTQFPDSPYRALARSLLARSDDLRGAASETLERFVENGRIAKYLDGNVLAVAGGEMEALVVVLSGSIEVGLSTVSGKHFVIGYLGPGLIFGLIPILDGGGPVHDARSHGEAVALLIPRAVFAQAVREDPGLAQALLRLFCKRSRALYGSAAASALAPLRVRVARALLSLLPVHGVRHGETVSITLKLSQEEFAALLGASRQSVNRELKALENAGFICLAYSSIRVLDCGALNAVAGMDEDPAPVK